MQPYAGADPIRVIRECFLGCIRTITKHTKYTNPRFGCPVDAMAYSVKWSVVSDQQIMNHLVDSPQSAIRNPQS